MKKDDNYWKNKLYDQQYRVLREADTEAPFSGELLNEDREGVYRCGACGQELFLSEAKFESHCGWPSFYEPANKDVVNLREDLSHGMQRIEVKCSNCGSHLGHVFNDAPDQPTGMRFCINSLSLDFKTE